MKVIQILGHQDAIPEVNFMTADNFGLDIRAGHLAYDEEADVLVSRWPNSTLMYYGGFEYIGQEHVTVVGRYCYFSPQDNYGERCSRIDECIQFFKERFND